MSDNNSNANGHLPKLSAEAIADRTRFRFREQELDIPEIGGSITLKSLTVEERESLPNPQDLAEIDDRGRRTVRALEDAGLVFSIICVEPKLTPEAATQALRRWPAEAFDRVTEAYAALIGNPEEAQAAAAEFPG